MQVTVAKTAGFCFGVERAVDRVYDLINNGVSPIYTLGPIIHNEEVVNDLENRGIRIITQDDLDRLHYGTVVIRSHGIGKAVYEHLEKTGLDIVDMTCPFVKKIHQIVRKASEAGDHVVIAGDALHPEVIGICGWCEGPWTVIGSAEEAEAFVPPKGCSVTVVSQTTFHDKKFENIVEILENKSYHKVVLDVPDLYHIVNTICSATKERQAEAKQLAVAADTMLVIGGRHSSNTQKLYEICKRECENTYYIQTPVDLDSDMFQRSSFVGITAGASTPKRIIEEVQRHVRKNF
ncbi:MAG: 4-hydroxy-3-methylbut-2-enyl diphosphate reductase [Blautia sp.]|nr:4-hydroxy-3-methylbut-2-enyl diphosphate reductase [Blautia sp.]